MSTYLLWINPEPWAIGTVQYKSISPNPNLVAFQQAVKEELEGIKMFPDDAELTLAFYFWRQTAKYIDTGDKVRQRNQADTTNMQKGLEDALQGVMFKNDRQVQEIHSAIVEQGPNVEPRILIVAMLYTGPWWVRNLDTDVFYEALDGKRPKKKTDNTWRGPNASSRSRTPSSADPKASQG